MGELPPSLDEEDNEVILQRPDLPYYNPARRWKKIKSSELSTKEPVEKGEFDGEDI